MKICIECGKENTRKTLVCNRCYNHRSGQWKKVLKRGRKFYKKLSDKWEKERSNLICVGCGKTFKGNRSDQKYCTVDCRQGVKTKKPKGKANCIICGTEFIQKRRDSKACSPECIRKWEYSKRNKDKKRFYERTRDARKRSNGGNLSWKEWNDIKKEYKYTCPACLKKEPEINLTIDHIVPISKKGEHTKENIQPLCLKCNILKNNKLIKKYERPD